MSQLPPKPFRSRVWAVIADPLRGRVLTRAGRLPEQLFGGSVFFGEGVPGAFGALLGVELALLRRVWVHKLPDSSQFREREVVWTLDPLAEGSDAGVPDAEWSVPADLPAEQRPWAEAALVPAPAARPLWQRSGGQASIRAWLDAELDEQERTALAPLQTLKHSQISYLLRVPTGSGPLYLKAVPDFFRREVPITCWLSRELPGAAPPVLAADEREGFLLLADAGEELALGVADWNGSTAGRSAWTYENSRALLRHVARLQRGSEARLDELRALGVPQHGPEYVLGWLPRLLGGEYFHSGEPEGLSAEEAQRLRAMRPELEAALTRLATSPIPLTLGHGDLHEGNVARRGEHTQPHFTLLDWSDACLTHPFLDASPSYLVPPEHAEAAAEAYLAAWAGLLPPSELRALYRDGQRAGELYRVLGYVNGILLGVEDASEWGTAYLWHLRGLLKMMAVGGRE